MMERAIERCFADPAVHTILLDPLVANAGAQRLYERLVFEFVALREFCGDQCRVYRLRRGKASSAAN
jgi:aminoglycoside 6'-N-acetyltransferase